MQRMRLRRARREWRSISQLTHVSWPRRSAIGQLRLLGSNEVLIHRRSRGGAQHAKWRVNAAKTPFTPFGESWGLPSWAAVMAVLKWPAEPAAYGGAIHFIAITGSFRRGSNQA